MISKEDIFPNLSPIVLQFVQGSLTIMFFLLGKTHIHGSMFYKLQSQSVLPLYLNF